MSEITIRSTIEIIRQSIAALGEWDWNQDFVDAAGERHIISGESEIDDLPESAQSAAREYAEFVRNQFAEAVEHAEAAIDALSGDDIDIDAALSEIADAARAERACGDENEMRAARKAVEALAAAE